MIHFRILYYDSLGIVDVSFATKEEEFTSKESTKVYAEKHKLELEKDLNHSISYKIVEDKNWCPLVFH